MGRKHEETKEFVREAIGQIKRGDITDALTTLERAAYPKWSSISLSALDYSKAIGGAKASAANGARQ